MKYFHFLFPAVLCFLLLTGNQSRACDGPVLGGSTNSSEATPCLCTLFYLCVTGSSFVENDGFLLLWQLSTTGAAGPWADIVGATDDCYDNIESTAATRHYRRRIVCTASGDTAYSTTLAVTASLCYCQPGYVNGTASGYYIDRVQIENTTLDHTSGPSTNPPYYNDFGCTIEGTQLMKGAAYWMNVYTGTATGQQVVAAWIDYNGDGDFNDASESLGSYQPATNAAAHIMMNVPNTSGILTGTTCMRVRLSGNTINVLDPCLSNGPNYLEGETEDYVIQIIPNECVDATVAGTVTMPSQVSLGDTVCPTIAGQNGQLIHWEFSDEPTFTPIDYQIVSYDGCFVLQPPLSNYPYIRGVFQNGGCPIAYSDVFTTDVDTLFDLAASAAALGLFKAGFDDSLQVNVTNNGYAQSGNVSVVLDSVLSFINAVPPPDSVIGDTLLWNTGVLSQSEAWTAQVNVLVSATAVPWSFAGVTVAVQPAVAETFSGNNEMEFVDVVYDSFDPNDKIVASGNVLSTSDVVNGAFVRYVVRFQNTGNAPATNIVVADTLSPMLDWSTFESLSASHSYDVNVQGGVVNWTFDNIELPDSNSNEPASHGYLMFRVKPLVTLTAGSQIYNTAAIYFDFNEPVFTNAALVTVEEPNGVTNLTETSLDIYPNPAGDFIVVSATGLPEGRTYRITDVSGKNLLSGKLENYYRIPVARLEGGVYLLNALVNNKVTRTVKFVKR